MVAESVRHVFAATKMEGMLLLRPPPRALLEQGPPASMRAALQAFRKREKRSVADAVLLAQRFGYTLQLSLAECTDYFRP